MFRLGWSAWVGVVVVGGLAVGCDADPEAVEAAVPDAAAPDAAALEPDAGLPIGDTVCEQEWLPGPYPNQLQEGDGLFKHTVTAADARCNDGSPAAIYVREGVGAHRNDWVFHVQGGGGCGDFTVCQDRWCGRETNARGEVVRGVYNRSKMSSTGLPEQIAGRGINSADEAISDFASWSHVYFYYCTSDFWRGQGSSTMEGPDGTAITMHRTGHLNLVRAFEDLRDGLAVQDQTLPPLADAATVLWTGTSAGSGGARQNADWARAQFGAETAFWAVFDAAVSPTASTFGAEYVAPIEAAKRAAYDRMLAQDAVPEFVDESCEAALGATEAFRCTDDELVLSEHVAVPFFVRADLQDFVSGGPFLDAGLSRPAYTAAVRQMLQNLAAVRSPLGMYGPKCGQHVGMENDEWFFAHRVGASMDTALTFHDAIVQWMTGVDLFVVDGIDGVRSECGEVDDER
jgi:hypothetical protein